MANFIKYHKLTSINAWIKGALMNKLSIFTIIIVFPGYLMFSCISKTIPPPSASLPVPTEKQLAWHELEMYAFVHFTTNTFTDKEWGYGNENPEVFNPTQLNVDQWVKTIKDAGMKALILTCKHHDGFCLWPSAYTKHSVKSSRWKNGQGDVVKDVADACRKHGLKFGIYLSPWDRNRADYGTAAYVEYYRNQLREIFTNYGPIFEMWFDGANGGDGYYGGSNEKRKIDGSKYYDWPGTIKIIRDLDSSVVFFSDAGPDIRWCGNEKGYIGDTNWCTINTDTIYAGKPDINNLLNTGEENGKSWVPAEVDVSIRPGWFYHQNQDTMVKTAEELFHIYLSSVGRGANLLLNIPPDQRGLIHENDVKALKEFKKLKDSIFNKNMAFNSKVVTDSYRGNSKEYAGSNVTDGKKNTYWTTDDEIKKGQLDIYLKNKETIKYIIIQEYIKLGQRIKSFTISVWIDNNWMEIQKSTTIGYKRILKLNPVKTNRIRINIVDSKACPIISNVEIY